MDIRLLRADEIDVRVGGFNKEKTGGFLLLYKDARVDMNLLDETFGVTGWQRRHELINGNLFCTISIWDDEKKQWISKEDTGAESFTEKEKGLASDSFKRACFNFGIGIELYDYPFIFFQLYPNEFKVSKSQNGKDVAKTTFDFNLKKWSWEMTNVQGKITLKGYDNSNRLRYDSNKDFNGIPKGNEPTQQEQPKTPPTLPKMDDTLYGKAVKSSKLDSLEKALVGYDLLPQQKEGIEKRINELKK
jgi:hypothetical protein